MQVVLTVLGFLLQFSFVIFTVFSNMSTNQQRFSEDAPQPSDFVKACLGLYTLTSKENLHVMLIEKSLQSYACRLDYPDGAFSACKLLYYISYTDVVPCRCSSSTCSTTTSPASCR